jgi:hypothetical protein
MRAALVAFMENPPPPGAFEVRGLGLIDAPLQSPRGAL